MPKSSNKPADKPDFYARLGVPHDATAFAIKEAFRALALKYYPDPTRLTVNETSFNQIVEAFAVLSNPKKRIEYDTHGFADLAGLDTQALLSGLDLGEIVGDVEFRPQAGGLIERSNRRGRHVPQRGADLEVRLAVPLRRIAEGGEEQVMFSRTLPCPDCNGSGAKNGTAPHGCRTCGGSGRLIRLQTKDSRRMPMQQIAICPTCNGQGRIVDPPCPVCRGRGELDHEETVGVNVPQGVEEGTALRVVSYGMPSRDPKGAPGDLLVFIHSQSDSRFERDGADLWHAVSITVPEAVLGTELTVPTLDGPAPLVVPAGSQPDSVLRLRGKGLPRYGGKTVGDLFVRLRVQVPARPTLQETALYQQLRVMESGTQNEAQHDRRAP